MINSQTQLRGDNQVSNYADGLNYRAAARNSTAVTLCGLGLTYLLLPESVPSEMFFTAAVGSGLALAAGLVIEARVGLRNLVRIDIVMLCVLYALTFLEFLFPQPDVDNVVTSSAAMQGITAVFIGFIGLLVGRLLFSDSSGRKPHAVTQINLFRLFVLAAVMGYLHILLAVQFDIFEAFRQMALPRFEQSWGRGRYGDAYALLVEIGALIYVIPPIAGAIYARSQAYTAGQKLIVGMILLVTLYYGFSTGTRSILATYIVTGLGGYLLNRPLTTSRHFFFLVVPAVAVLIVATHYMLQFRTIGLENFSFADDSSSSLFIDRNIVVISQLTQFFPSAAAYLGFEVPFNALIRPIPRVLWPGKPEGLSLSIESVVGADSVTTVSTTFVGEAYMSGGYVAVLLMAAILGAAAELWNRVGRRKDSPFDQLLYVSAFLCAAITMRSMLWVLPTMLPTLGLWTYGKLLNWWSGPTSPDPTRRASL